jgi:hypothetical protein
VRFARVALFIAAACALTRTADGQSVTTEASVSAGASSEDLTSIATQLRAFGETPLHIRYYVEGAWGRTTDDESDAFGAAYPYRNRFELIEAYGERLFKPRGTVLGIRGGRYRVPFGIYNASDHAYTGFLRAPLIRYEDYAALSNNFLEQGLDLVGGIPRLTVETSLGIPGDVGEDVRPSGFDRVVRAQGTLGRAIVGVSHLWTSPYQPAVFAHGKAQFTGLDLRWMRDGVQLRGEWLTGQPYDGTTTTGWYADAIVHRTWMGPVTAVARVERVNAVTSVDGVEPLGYDVVAPIALHPKRQTIGARVRLLYGLSTQVNVFHNTGLLEQYRNTMVDVGVTYSVRRH